MSLQDQLLYHARRAMRELDQGLVASSTPAARAHLELSSLHMAKMRELQGGNQGTKPPVVMG